MKEQIILAVNNVDLVERVLAVRFLSQNIKNLKIVNYKTADEFLANVSDAVEVAGNTKLIILDYSHSLQREHFDVFLPHVLGVSYYTNNPEAYKHWIAIENDHDSLHVWLEPEDTLTFILAYHLGLSRDPFDLALNKLIKCIYYGKASDFNDLEKVNWHGYTYQECLFMLYEMEFEALDIDPLESLIEGISGLKDYMDILRNPALKSLKGTDDRIRSGKFKPLFIRGQHYLNCVFDLTVNQLAVLTAIIERTHLYVAESAGLVMELPDHGWVSVDFKTYVQTYYAVQETKTVETIS